MDLVPPAGTPASESAGRSFGAAILDENGAPVGFVLVFTRAGRLDRLEFASIVDRPLSTVPDPERLVSER